MVLYTIYNYQAVNKAISPLYPSASKNSSLYRDSSTQFLNSKQ